MANQVSTGWNVELGKENKKPNRMPGCPKRDRFLTILLVAAGLITSVTRARFGDLLAGPANTAAGNTNAPAGNTADSGPGSPTDKYDGQIPENTPRVRDLREQLTTKLDIQNNTQTWKLTAYFARFDEDYLEVYDREGELVLIRFREDRFQQRVTRRLRRELRKGAAYDFVLRFEGIRAGNTNQIQRWGEAPAAEIQKKLGQKNYTLIFWLVDWQPRRLKSVRY